MSIKHQKNGTYVTTLRDFGGLDLTDSGASGTPRFSRLENMWRDYAAGDGEVLESFPGFRALTCLDGAIHGIWKWEVQGVIYLLVHAGAHLYTCPLSATDNATLSAPLTRVRNDGITLADVSSTGFSHGENFYLLDGQGYFAVRMHSGTPALSEVKDLYTPVTYSDGNPYEMRNILSRYTENRFRIGAASGYAGGSRGLRYHVTDEENFTCEVSGYDATQTDEVLYIPAETAIGGVPFRVTAIGWKAFSCASHLREVHIAEGIEIIDLIAFERCGCLERVYLPDSIRYIRRRAFQSCPRLERLVIGRNLTEVAEQVLKGSTAVVIDYHGEHDDYAAITIHEDNEILLAATVNYLDQYPVQVLHFPLYEQVTSVTSVILNGTPLLPNEGSPYYALDTSDDGWITHVILHANGDDLMVGKELRITLCLSEMARGTVAGEVDFAAASNAYDGTTHAALAQCTQATAYDGRIFFTGNPRLPATVFYTARDLSGHINPAYVGIYNYFFSGDGTEPITALLATASYLAVLSGDTPSGGRVSYYHGADTQRDLVPRIYVTNDSVNGRGCTGVACTLRDDPIFLSHEGLEALSRESLNTERSLKHRSTFVDPALMPRLTGPVLHAVWEGYLFLLFSDGEAFLADSRRTASTTRGSEYEWYHLTGVGCYTDDIPVYRYADVYCSESPTVFYQGVETPLTLHPHAGALPCGCDDATYPDIFPEILSGTTTDGTSVAYIAEGAGDGMHLYLLSMTGERTGGVFSPPTALGVVGEKLIFGCANGCLAVVNTDRRGVMNDRQAGAYTPEEYARRFGRVINPEWYTYAGHRYLAGLATVPDDCNVSNYTKGTLRGTTVLDLKAGVGHGFSVEVRLFRTTGPEASEVLHASPGGLDFTAFDFGATHFGACENTTLVLNERSRRYLKKQYCIFSDSIARPFGIRSLAYTWQVEGKVKNI